MLINNTSQSNKLIGSYLLEKDKLTMTLEDSYQNKLTATFYITSLSENSLSWEGDDKRPASLIRETK